MAERYDLFSLTLTQYEDTGWGWRYMGKARRALDLGHISLIIECWFLR